VKGLRDVAKIPSYFREVNNIQECGYFFGTTQATVSGNHILILRTQLYLSKGLILADKENSREKMSVLAHERQMSHHFDI
jgi:hypothetical protein